MSRPNVSLKVDDWTFNRILNSGEAGTWWLDRVSNSSQIHLPGNRFTIADRDAPLNITITGARLYRTFPDCALHEKKLGTFSKMMGRDHGEISEALARNYGASSLTTVVIYDISVDHIVSTKVINQDSHPSKYANKLFRYFDLAPGAQSFLKVSGLSRKNLEDWLYSEIIFNVVSGTSFIILLERDYQTVGMVNIAPLFGAPREKSDNERATKRLVRPDEDSGRFRINQLLLDPDFRDAKHYDILASRVLKVCNNDLAHLGDAISPVNLEFYHGSDSHFITESDVESGFCAALARQHTIEKSSKSSPK